MWWKKGKAHKGEETSYIYCYYTMVDRNDVSATWYNAVLKKMMYPIKKELIVESILAKTDEEFLEFYNKKVKL